MARSRSTAPALLLHGCLHLLEQSLGDDLFVLARERLIAERHPPGVDGIGEHPPEIRYVPGLAVAPLSLLGLPALPTPSPPIQFLGDGHQRRVLSVEAEDSLDLLRLLLVDEEPPPFRGHVVPQPWHAPRPLPLASRRAHLVSRPVRHHLPLELGEAQE